MSNVRRRRLQKTESTGRTYIKNWKVLEKLAELEIFILKIAVDQCLSFGNVSTLNIWWDCNFWLTLITTVSRSESEEKGIQCSMCSLLRHSLSEIGIAQSNWKLLLQYVCVYLLIEIYFLACYRIANCSGNRYHTLVICHMAYYWVHDNWPRTNWLRTTQIGWDLRS